MNLRDRNWKSSATYRRYARNIGKLVACDSYNYEDENRGWKQQLYMISAVSPQKYYRNRYAYKFIAVGSHQDFEVGCTAFMKDLNRFKTYKEKGKESEFHGWRFL